jgi:transposase-like protein
LITRVGKLELRVPQDREGRFSTELFERYQRSERALVAALAEMYVQGVSTRKVKAITEELCGHSFSASSISAINQRLDASLAQFAGRPLAEAFAGNRWHRMASPLPQIPTMFRGLNRRV